MFNVAWVVSHFGAMLARASTVNITRPILIFMNQNMSLPTKVTICFLRIRSVPPTFEVFF